MFVGSPRGHYGQVTHVVLTADVQADSCERVRQHFAPSVPAVTLAVWHAACVRQGGALVVLTGLVERPLCYLLATGSPASLATLRADVVALVALAHSTGSLLDHLTTTDPAAVAAIRDDVDIESLVTEVSTATTIQLTLLANSLHVTPPIVQTRSPVITLVEATAVPPPPPPPPPLPVDALAVSQLGAPATALPHLDLHTLGATDAVLIMHSSPPSAWCVPMITHVLVLDPPSVPLVEQCPLYQIYQIYERAASVVGVRPVNVFQFRRLCTQATTNSGALVVNLRTAELSYCRAPAGWSVPSSAAKVQPHHTTTPHHIDSVAQPPVRREMRLPDGWRNLTASRSGSTPAAVRTTSSSPEPLTPTVVTSPPPALLQTSSAAMVLLLPSGADPAAVVGLRATEVATNTHTPLVAPTATGAIAAATVSVPTAAASVGVGSAEVAAFVDLMTALGPAVAHALRCQGVRSCDDLLVWRGAADRLLASSGALSSMNATDQRRVTQFLGRP